MTRPEGAVLRTFRTANPNRRREILSRKLETLQASFRIMRSTLDQIERQIAELNDYCSVMQEESS